MYSPADAAFGSAFAQPQGTRSHHLAQSELELSLSARNLLNRDVVSKSDPFCILYTFVGGKQYKEIGRTEVVKDDLNPNWVKKILIPYQFNVHQQVRLEVWDFDPISGNEFLGRADTTLAAVVAANGGVYKEKLKTGSGTFRRIGGEIWLQAEEVSGNKQIALIQFSANGLDKKDTFGKSDPYLVISRSNPDGTWSAVHKTEVIKNTLNPTWRPFNIRVQALCNGNYERQLKVDCFDWDDGTNDDLIGSFTTNLKRLTSGPANNSYDCINEKKKLKKKSYKNSGIIKLNSITITQEVTFLDYVRGGTQMHFAVAIDFTASNGPPHDPRSLHRLDPTGENPNSYEIALKAVGEILQPYDTQGLMAAFGFGAKIPPYGQLSHHFPLNNNANFPYCRGTDEILNHYKTMLSSITLHGPTNFAPTINFAANAARGLQDGKHYFVLLIVTDGVITDMNETLEAIVSASSLPISIIIVGVGNADFSAMEFLDGDGRVLTSRGRRATRDIVQFVAMRNYMRGHWVQNQYELGRDVLAEIPQQFIQFMNSRGYKPGQPGSNANIAGGFPEPTSETASTHLAQTSTQPAPQFNSPSSSYPPPPYSGPYGSFPAPPSGFGPPSAYSQPNYSSTQMTNFSNPPNANFPSQMNVYPPQINAQMNATQSTAPPGAPPSAPPPNF